MSDERILALLLASSSVAVGGVAMRRLLSTKPAMPEVWYEIHFGREVDPEGVVAFLRTVAADRRPHIVAIEVVGHAGVIQYRIGVAAAQAEQLMATLSSFVPSATTELIASSRIAAPTRAWKIGLSTNSRALRTEDTESVARALLGVLTSTTKHQTLILQWLLGPRRSAMSIGDNKIKPAESWGDLLKAAAIGSTELDHDSRKALATKLSEPGFRTIGRVAVHGSNRKAAAGLATRVLGALRLAEAPGIAMAIDAEKSDSVAWARPPREWPTALNVREVATVIGWPVGNRPLPGMNRDGARPVRPQASITGNERVLGPSAFPGDQRRVVLPAKDALQHLHVIGPTGTGKSTLLLALILQDIDADRGVVVIDPKGDLIEDVLARVPQARHHDVVVIDPADDQRPVGLNVLQGGNRSPELIADQVLAVFHGLYKDSWGPRTQDILHASLLTLAGRPGVTLCDLPVLLSNAHYRATVTKNLTDEIALKPFWHWFENVSEGERLSAIAPVMNKLRAFLLRPRMRAVLGQAEPHFDLNDVFTKNKIVLVSLAKGTLGPEAAALLGSLVVSQLWQAALGRVAVPAARRSPVMVYVDEFQDYLHLPTDLADVLAQARGLGMGLTLAHQHLAQLTPNIRSAVLANARSRVCFQLSVEDARTMAGFTNELAASDYTNLARFTAYATLVSDGNTMPAASIRTLAPSSQRQDPAIVRRLSRETYGRPVAEVEAELRRLVDQEPDDPEPLGRRRRT